MKIFIFITILLLAAAMTEITEAHVKRETFNCEQFSVLHATHDPVRLKVANLPNGLVAELYDLNGDTKPDVASYSATHGIVNQETGEYEHSAVPIFYEVDLENNDNQPDTIFYDPIGKGLCKDLTFYASGYLNERKVFMLSEFEH